MSDERTDEIAKAIEADAGAALPELRQALREATERKGRITTPEQLLIHTARKQLGLSQADFATRIGTPLATLRDWEQGRFTLPGAALCLMKLLIAHPDLVDELAADEPAQRTRDALESNTPASIARPG